MRRYLYVDREQVASFHDQVVGSDSRRRRRKTVSLSVAGPRVDVAEESRIATDHEMIEDLSKQLASMQLLDTTRPHKVSWNLETRFVHEIVDAIKMVIPKSVVAGATDIDEPLVVWVADPRSWH